MLIKFLALVTTLFLVLFLVAQLIHAVDDRSHQTHSFPEPPHTATRLSPLSSTGTHATSAASSSALFMAAAPLSSASSTGAAAPQSPTASFEPATTFTTLSAADDEQSDSIDAERLPSEVLTDATDSATSSNSEEKEAAGQEGSGKDELTGAEATNNEASVHLTFTATSAPSRPLCRALAGKVASTVEYGAEESDEDTASNEQLLQAASNHDLRVLLTLDNVAAMVDRVDLHVKLNSDEHKHCHHADHHHPHHSSLAFDSADERHGLTKAELTYRMVAHQHGVTKRGQQHWEKLINFLAHTTSGCAQIAFTLHQRSLACTTPFRPLQLPAALLEGGEADKAVIEWEGSKEDNSQQPSRDIVSLINSLASLISSVTIGLAAKPTTASTVPLTETYRLPPGHRPPASPCRNLSFTASARRIGSTRIHLLFTPAYHHPAISKVEVFMHNVSGSLPHSSRPRRMSSVRLSHMPVYRAVLRTAFSSTGRPLSFDYSFRVTLKQDHVLCLLPGGHYSSNSSTSATAAPAPQSSQSSPHPSVLAERCPVTDVFNISAQIIRSTAIQPSTSNDTKHAYKLVLTSHLLQLDWVHVHLFVNSSDSSSVIEGRYRMAKALIAQQQQPSLSVARQQWEHAIGVVNETTAEVEYAFTYHFNGSSCDTTGKVSSVEKLLASAESVEPHEQIKSLFHVLGAGESGTVMDEREKAVNKLMDEARQEDGVRVFEERPDVDSEEQYAEAASLDDQMDVLASGPETTSLHASLHPSQPVSVSIDAMGRIVPASAPHEVVHHADVSSTSLPPYHQYQPFLDAMHATAPATAAFAPPASPPTATTHNLALQQAGAYGGEPMDGRCGHHDYECQIESMCHRCMNRPHGDALCMSCSHLHHCRTHECAHTAVRHISHTSAVQFHSSALLIGS